MRQLLVAGSEGNGDGFGAVVLGVKQRRKTAGSLASCLTLGRPRKSSRVIAFGGRTRDDDDTTLCARPVSHLSTAIAAALAGISATISICSAALTSTANAVATAVAF